MAKGTLRKLADLKATNPSEFERKIASLPADKQEAVRNLVEAVLKRRGKPRVVTEEWKAKIRKSRAELMSAIESLV